MPGLGVMGFMAARVGSPFAFSFVTAGTINTSDLTTYTFSGVSTGTADASRYTLVGVVARDQSGTNIAFSGDQTIGGVAASVVGQTSGNAGFAGHFIVANPTGTTADIVVTFNGTALWCKIYVWRVINPSGGVTPVDHGGAVGTGALSDTLATTAGGGAAGCRAGNNSSADTFTNLPDNQQNAAGDGDRQSAASNLNTSGSATTFTITPGSGSAVGGAYFSTWGP